MLRQYFRSCCCNKSKLLKFIDFILNDLIVVFFSLADIVLDILVCYQFYQAERFIFFYFSVVIFCFAQLSYSFLFVGTWANDHSPLQKICLFLVVLPFGQFVPLFTWLESFRFASLDNILVGCGLKPTFDPLVSLEGDDDYHNGDMLWDYIQRKYQAHAGFLAEALAEAIPQCILQTIAVITAGKASPVLTLSIVVSITVIASKGYLLSYSIHRPTFLFNYICVMADCFNLFAICAWLFLHSDDFFTNTFNQLWLILFIGGCFLLVIGGLCLVVFSMIDDHLKYCHSNEWQIVLNGQSIWFDIYLVRFVAWCVAVVPVCVIFLTSKLSIIPICVFQSMDPEHAQRWLFYTNLYRFLSLPQQDLRLQVTNLFFINCKKEMWRLKVGLESQTVTRDEFFRLRDRVSRIEQKKIALQTWLINVGKSVTQPPRDAAVRDAENLERLERMSIAFVSEGEVSRTDMRRAIYTERVENTFTKTRREFSLRSAIFRIWCDTIDGMIVSNFDRVMFNIGFFFMTIGLLCSFLWVFFFAGFVTYGTIFPLIELIKRTNFPLEGNVELAFYLTCVHLFLMVLLLSLSPAVYRFQSTRHDVIDIKGFPGIFYDVMVVKEIHKRFVKEIDKREIHRVLDYRFGNDIALYIKSFIDDSS